MASPSLRAGTPAGRWVVAATVLGSGVVCLDSTVVTVALPAIGEDLDASLSGLQWTVNAYLVTLSALLLLGGNLGDRFGRRRLFVLGLVGFSAASVLCAVAPTSAALVAARALQGVAGAVLVPGSLAVIAATFHPDDRGRAIGTWSGLAGVVSSIGPFVGGWLVDAVSWRGIFLLNVPLAAIAVWIAVRHVPETRAPGEQPLDVVGAVLVTVALAAFSYAAIEHAGTGSWLAAALGAGALVAFVVVQRTSSHPMLPLDVFRSAQFTGTNLTTLAVYAGLGGALFLLVLRLQLSLGYSALEAGAASVPFTVLMLLLSPTAGQVGQRVGARWPLTIGPFVSAAGIALLSGVAPGDSYTTAVLPGVLVFGLGMSITVAPLTASVLAAVDDAMTGLASGVNNAVARLANLVAVAALPALAGIATDGDVAASLDDGYPTALRIAAAVTAAGGVVAFLLVRRTAPVEPAPQASVFQSCQDPGVLTESR